jgi:hypothetical protein
MTHTFTIEGQPFTFNLEVDEQDQLTSFTATGEGKNYTCKIRAENVTSQADLMCCDPNGCTSGPC